jgi:hypothetical protein
MAFAALQQPSCSKQASSAAAQVPNIKPSGFDIAGGVFWGAVGVGAAIVAAPESAAAAVVTGGAGVVTGLTHNALFNAGAKATFYALTFSNCVTPSSAPYFTAP